MRNQHSIVWLYAWLNIAIVAAAVADLPFCKKILSTYLIISTMFLNLRFDASSGAVSAIDTWKLDQITLTICVVAGLHFMKANECALKIRAGKR